ncbi:hypothetical protein ES677_04760 [Bizionia gelidisalsuginis]|uniref:Uncharacterized protein n=1 Tax=Bizionia gelidisalsuginis TaxID=291188 RepID=A0ABY3MCK7_9FLAO|nr:hypothetical protein [Bizionia gelidisalsuginis]TYC15656.1 hypothetical protein ES677_04760 [Bizionia gelidisalsuginis]
MSFLSDEVSKQFKEGSFDKVLSISDDQKVYIDKIIKLSKKHNFELLFLTLPMYNTYYNSKIDDFNNINKYLNQLSISNKNVRFLDMNNHQMIYSNDYIKNENLGFNQHLNYKGQIVASNILANYVNINYSLKTDSVMTVKTVEDLIYNLNLNVDNANLKGGINIINNKKFKSKKEITVSINSELEIKGWLFNTDFPFTKESKKHIILKKDDDFIYFSVDGQVYNRESVGNEKKFGLSAKNSNFTFIMPARLLEKGAYSVFLVLETGSGEFIMKNSGKNIKIE